MSMIRIGADPEFEVRRNGRFVSADEVLRGGLHAQIGTDGNSNTGELRPKPGQPVEVLRDLRKLIGKMEKELPGLDVFAGAQQNVTLGGHIHFSGVEPYRELVEALDKFIGVPLRSISNHDRRAQRGYGRESEFRRQPHGWEYRTPCSWISHPHLALAVLHVAHLLALAAEKSKLVELETWKDLSHFARSEKVPHGQWAVSALKAIISRLTDKGIKLEQVEVFQAWKKRPRVVQQRVEHRVSFQFSGDESLAGIDAQMGLEPAAANAVTYRVVGAAQHRANDARVFLPQSHRRSDSGEDIIAGIPVGYWEQGSIGLSWELRQHLDEAVAVLRELKTVRERALAEPQELDPIAVLEGTVR